MDSVIKPILIMIFILLSTNLFGFVNEKIINPYSSQQNTESTFFKELDSNPLSGNNSSVIRLFPEMIITSKRALYVQVTPREFQQSLKILYRKKSYSLNIPQSTSSYNLYIPLDEGAYLKEISFSEGLTLKESFASEETFYRVDFKTDSLHLNLTPDEKGYVILSLRAKNKIELFKDSPYTKTLKGGPAIKKIPLFLDPKALPVKIAPFSEILELNISDKQYDYPFPSPLYRTLRSIINNPIEGWRNQDYEVYQWAEFDNILIFDTKNYNVQDALFRRLAFFVEKKGYKGRLLSDRQLQGKHGWNAHDYRASDLARFFNLADESGFLLNSKELELLKILLKHSIIEYNLGGTQPYKAGEGAIISISQESSPLLRDKFLTHEASHGLYFISSDYRAEVKGLWESLSDDERKVWRLFLGWYGYDPSNEDLMINEFQAYLVQQAVDETGPYFINKLASVQRSYKKDASLIQRTLVNEGASYTKASFALNSWLYKKWGLSCGDFYIEEGLSGVDERGDIE